MIPYQVTLGINPIHWRPEFPIEFDSKQVRERMTDSQYADYNAIRKMHSKIISMRKFWQEKRNVKSNKK